MFMDSPSRRKHRSDWNAFQSASRAAGKKLSPLTKLIEDAARLSPNDVEAQQRAKAVADFYSEVEEFTKHEYLPDEAVHRRVSAGHSKGKADILPIEIYHQILGYVDELPFRARQRTFTALACSCSKLRNLAEPYIYNYPPDLETIDRQWRLLFTLTVNPRLGQLIRSLKLSWWMEGYNRHLLKKILSTTPNIHTLTLRRGPEFHEACKLQEDDVEFISWVLNACPNLGSFSYLTGKELETSEALNLQNWRAARPEDYDKFAQDARFAPTRHLTQLSLEGVANWIEQLLLPHASSKLQSLSLKHGLEFGQNPRLILELARLSPSLQTLSIVSSNSRLRGILQAFKTWGSTLRSLHLDTFRLPSDERITSFEEVLPSMTALEDLTLGWRFSCSVQTLEAIVHSQPSPRFKSLDIRRMKLVPGEALQHRVEKALASLLSSHSPTLTRLRLMERLNNQELPDQVLVGPSVFQSCRQAKKLRQLWILPTPEVESSDVDGLLETCPELGSIPIELMKRSRNEWEWMKRIMVGKTFSTG